MKEDVFSDTESLISTLAKLFALDGQAREVAILANAQSQLKQIEYDNWNGGTYVYSLSLRVPDWLYSQIASDIESCENALQERAQFLISDYGKYELRQVRLLPIVSVDKDWRNKAHAWVAGENISNQGRVRSDNIPARTEDGLLFRSEPEIFLYKALKSLGLSFAPLPVFIRGGDSYKRIEPDFVIIKAGIIMVVEVDGDTVHLETPVEAHDRTTMLVHEGAHVERIRASECKTLEAATMCAKKLLNVLERLKSLR